MRDVKTVLDVCNEVADEKGESCYRDRLCVESHALADVAKMCIPGGGNDVFRMLSERGCRVGEISSQTCPEQNHDHVVYVTWESEQ